MLHEEENINFEERKISNSHLSYKMKRKIFLAIILLSGLLLAVYLTTQSSDKIEGNFFNLRFGMSEDELQQVVGTSLLTVDNSRSFCFANEYLAIREKAFSLKNYKVSDTHLIEDITLLFFDNKLYAIVTFTYNSKTEEMLTQEYGKPTTIVEKNETNEATIKNTWKLNYNKVKCTSFLRLKTDSYSLIMLNNVILEQILSENKLFEDQL